jgi:hypothetical protein
VFFNNKYKQKKELLKHPFFQRIDYWIYFNIDRLELKSHIKANMVKVFLKNYFVTFSDYMYNFINDEKYINPEELIGGYLEILNKIDSSSVSLGIPEIFLEKYRDIQSAYSKSIYVAIEDIISSYFYDNYMKKMTAILDLLMFNSIIINLTSEDVLNTMNGELETLLKGTIFDH